MSDCIYCGKRDSNESVLTCEECGDKVHLRCLRSGVHMREKYSRERKFHEERKKAGWAPCLAHCRITARHISDLVQKSSGRQDDTLKSLEKKRKPNIPGKVHSIVDIEPEPGPSSQEMTPSVSYVHPVSVVDDSSLSAYDDTSSVDMNNAESECSSGRVSAVDTNYWASFKSSNNMYSRAYVEPSETLSDCLFADEDEECSDVDVEGIGVDICCPPSQGFRDLGDLLQSQDTVKDVTRSQLAEAEVRQTEVKQEAIDEVPESSTDDIGSDAEAVDVPSGSLFNITKCKIPFLAGSELQEDADSKCLPMSEYEETQLLHQLRRVPSMSDVPSSVRRLYRKLQVRKLKRECNMPLFNLEDVEPSKKRSCISMSHPTHAVGDVRILDRFQNSRAIPRKDDNKRSFMIRLMGQSEPGCLPMSEYEETQLLHQLRRVPSMSDVPSSVRRLYRKLQVRKLKRECNMPLFNLEDVEPSKKRSCISMSHPTHAVGDVRILDRFQNSRAIPRKDDNKRSFMIRLMGQSEPGCVVLYRKLIIGFAFMVPDVGLNEAYISFLFTRPEWRRAGIASFMLYHLIQTCMGKDLTLHVSATNPALILYQKFGFKVEEFVQDFYDKYFPADSKECKHALFLRLSRH
ncbi:hypothetical protein C0J52_04289 [Blattella germanica]|nr:hypothetical protein C0J52_04289 [Blattella germanica]